MDALTITELAGGIILIGGVLGVIVKYVVPALKLGDRIASLERHEKKNFEMIEQNEAYNKLLCKGMLALIDNRITNNNVENLRLVKADLLNYLTGN